MKREEWNKLRYYFIHNNLSEQTRRRFFFWLKYDKDSDINSYMSELWNATDGQVSDSTFVALARVRGHINNQKKRHIVATTILKCTAIVAASVVCTFVIYNQFVETSKDREFISMTELFVHNGECKHVTLNDGSEVWLDAGSILVYPNQFGTGRRDLYLTGQARFKVHPDKHSPFTVKTKYMDVEALGTVFCVQSYPELKTVSAILEEGSIQVTTDDSQGLSQSRILKPNEKLVFYPQQDSIEVSDVDAQRLNKWIEGNLVFQDADFEEIVRSMERKYNVRINYDVSKFAGHRYYLRINQEESIEDALSLMKYLIRDFNYRINQSVITIY